MATSPYWCKQCRIRYHVPAGGRVAVTMSWHGSAEVVMCVPPLWIAGACWHCRLQQLCS
jgi:hypothetical protein